MSSTFGKLFKLTTFGESHGLAMGGVIEGCPSGLEISEKEMSDTLKRRRPGQSDYTTPRRERDEVSILSGTFQGVTTGTPIALLIKNQDAREKDYDSLKSVFRPGHADYTYQKKYGIRDYRGGGRASARETAIWVAAGTIAQKYLREQVGVNIKAFVTQIGPIKAQQVDMQVIDKNPFYFPDLSQVNALTALIEDSKKAGDSIGAKLCVEATGVPPGLGEPIFDKLDARIAAAMMGINAVKGVEIGAGFKSVTQKGSEHRDEMTPEGFLSNHSGGTLGGISSGQPIAVTIAFKPASSIRVPAQTIDMDNQRVEVTIGGRHDPCVGIRAVPIVEAMLALVLIDFYLLQKTRK